MPTHKVVSKTVRESKKRYITKKIRQQYKYWKILIGTAVLAICVVGAVETYTVKYINNLSPQIPARHFFVGVAKAETVERVPEITKTVKTTETDRQKVERIAEEECTKRGLGDFCTKDILGIAYAESRFDCNVVGDNGKSFGCFQIHRGWHPTVTVDQAKDIQFAINWTIDRLVNNKYPVMRSNAIMKHNGTPGTVKTKAYLATVNQYITSLKQ